jgi:hypothetical protein
MRCSRCRGLMVKSHFLDFQGSYRHMWTTSWRCVNCGDVQDSVIDQHRLARQETVVVPSSAEPDYQDDEVHLGAESIINKAA